MNSMNGTSRGVEFEGDSGRRRAPLRLVLAVFVLLPAIALVVIGGYEQKRIEKLRERGLNATATVVAKQPRVGRRVESVQLAFDAEGRNPTKAWLNVSAEEFARLQIGASLDVTYLRESPTDIEPTRELSAGGWSRGAINAFIAAGVWSIVSGLVWRYLERRAAK